MALCGGWAINATPSPLQNRYGLSRRKFLNAALSDLFRCHSSRCEGCPCIINCERVIPSTLWYHIVIGSSILVNESFKCRAYIPMSVNLRRDKYTFVFYVMLGAAVGDYHCRWCGRYNFNSAAIRRRVKAFVRIFMCLALLTL